MPTVIEKFDSRPAAHGDSPAATLRYTVKGTGDEQEALDALASAAPPIYEGLLRTTWRVEPLADGSDWWDGEVSYQRMSNAAFEVGESAYAFDIGPGTQRITQALEHIADYAHPGKTAPSFYGTIGVTDDEVEGCEIDRPVYTFSETHYKAAEFVDDDYKAALFAVACKPVNDAGFRGFAAGEVRFLGASGSQRGDDTWEITYRFAASPNVEDLNIGGITGVAKKGWEYLWVRFAPKVDVGAKVLIKWPVSVHVERVYGESDFSTLGIDPEEE